jgi:hypothetical protein
MSTAGGWPERPRRLPCSSPSSPSARCPTHQDPRCQPRSAPPAVRPAAAPRRPPPASLTTVSSPQAAIDPSIRHSSPPDDSQPPQPEMPFDIRLTQLLPASVTPGRPNLRSTSTPAGSTAPGPRDARSAQLLLTRATTGPAQLFQAPGPILMDKLG